MKEILLLFIFLRFAHNVLRAAERPDGLKANEVSKKDGWQQPAVIRWCEAEEKPFTFELAKANLFIFYLVVGKTRQLLIFSLKEIVEKTRETMNFKMDEVSI